MCLVFIPEGIPGSGVREQGRRLPPLGCNGASGEAAQCFPPPPEFTAWRSGGWEEAGIFSQRSSKDCRWGLHSAPQLPGAKVLAPGGPTALSDTGFAPNCPSSDSSHSACGASGPASCSYGSRQLLLVLCPHCITPKLFHGGVTPFEP